MLVLAFTLSTGYNTGYNSLVGVLAPRVPFLLTELGLQVCVTSQLYVRSGVTSAPLACTASLYPLEPSLLCFSFFLFIYESVLLHSTDCSVTHNPPAPAFQMLGLQCVPHTQPSQFTSCTSLPDAGVGYSVSLTPSQFTFSHWHTVLCELQIHGPHRTPGRKPRGSSCLSKALGHFCIRSGAVIPVPVLGPCAPGIIYQCGVFFHLVASL